MDEITVVQNELGVLMAVLANVPLFYESVAITYEKVKHTIVSQPMPVKLAGGIEAIQVTISNDIGQRDIYTLTRLKLQRHADHL